MSFSAVVPTGGIVGWRFVQRTIDAQIDTLSSSPQISRDTKHFAENIGKVNNASDLVSDRRLLRVALSAFGLESDINNTFFIKKVLEDGTTSSGALSRKLSDDRYREFSAAFGLGPGEIGQTRNPGAMNRVIDRFYSQTFEVSVGETDENLRIALYGKRELTELAARETSEDTKWFSVMSLPALRSMFETALGLPKAFGQLDIDKQLEIFKDKTQAVTGDQSVSQFANPDARDQLIQRFLTRAQLTQNGGGYSPAANALALLSR